MQRFQLGRSISVFIAFTSLFFQSCHEPTHSPCLLESDRIQQKIEDDSLTDCANGGSDEKENVSIEIEKKQAVINEFEFLTTLSKEKAGVQQEALSHVLSLKRNESTSQEERTSKRTRKHPQRYIEDPKMEAPVERQDFSTAEEDLKVADPNNHVGGNGFIGGYKWDTVSKLQEVSIEDYFKQELDKRLIQSSIIFREEKKKSKNKAEKEEVKEKHRKRVIEGSPSPNGKNKKPVNVRLKIVTDPDRIVSLHVAADVVSIFHKKDTKEQGASSYEDLANCFSKTIKTPDEKKKFVSLAQRAAIDKKDIQKEYEELSETWKDYLLDFTGILVAEITRANFHAKENKDHQQFNQDVIHNALKELETHDFSKVYVKQSGKLAPFAGKGGASFYRDGFIKSPAKAAKKLNFEPYTHVAIASFGPSANREF